MIFGETPLDEAEGVTSGVVIWPLCQFVEDYGVHDLEASLPALYDLTRRFSAEFAIRPFLIKWPEATLARLLEFVDEQVGLENTLIVLSADHGGPAPPPQLNQCGMEADYVDPETWDKEAGIARLKAEFGIGQELISEFSRSRERDEYYNRVAMQILKKLKPGWEDYVNW